MNWFDEQIKKRKESDEAAVEESVREMAGAVLGRCSPPEAEKEAPPRSRDAITEVLEYYRVKSKGVTESLREAGNDEEALEQILQPTGIIRRRVSLDGKWYRDASEAMLGRKKDSKSLVALLPDGWGGYRYHDPDTGRKVRVRRKNADQIEREAILLYRPFPQEKLTMGSLLRFMLQLISLGDIVMLAASMLTVTGVGLLIPYLNNKLFSEVAHSGSTTALVGTGVFMICAAISRLLFSTIQALMTARITEKISFSTRAAAMMRVLALPPSFFRKFSAGEMSKRSGYISEMCRQIANMVLNTGLSAVLSLVYLSQIFIYAPALVLPSLLVTLATLAVLAAHVLIQIKFSRRSMLAGGRESGLAYQMISGIRKIRLSGAERRAFARWGKAYAEAAKYTYSPPVFLKISSVITLAISLAGTILLYYVSVRSGVSVAEYYAFNSAYGMVNSAFLALSGAAAGAAQLRPMREMAGPIMEAEPETAEERNVVSGLEGKIELNNVSFKYEGSGRMILDNLSLTILPGQYVAVVGKTGCGKSTLLRVMLGFEKLKAGTVYYDGMDIRNTDLRSLRRRIGTVMQNGKLFDGDIFSNITISAPWLTMEQAWEAAEIAGIADDIRRMPMGMFTHISEGQGGISGGQRQRLLIARAVAARPGILMFDEATSALDNLTQKHVSEALDRMNCTRIVIAHRLSTIRECDRIIMLEDGKIIGDGSYEELLVKNRKFAEMVKRQCLDD